MYAFVHIPKTAGSTLRSILRQSFGARHCDIRVPAHSRADHKWITTRDLQLARYAYPNLVGIAGHRVASFQGLELAVPGLRYFTFLREPRARFIGNFRHLYRSRPEAGTRDAFFRYCADPEKHNVQTRWLCGSESASGAVAALESQFGFVGLTEEFNASLLMFCKWLDVKTLCPTYRSQNERNPHLDYDVYDDREAREWVEAANRLDGEVYRHACDKVMPRQRAAYGPELVQDVARFEECNRLAAPPPESVWSSIKRNFVYKPLLHFGVR